MSVPESAWSVFRTHLHQDQNMSLCFLHFLCTSELAAALEVWSERKSQRTLSQGFPTNGSSSPSFPVACPD